MMSKQYHTPKVVEYGPMGQLTLGASGTLPDLDLSLNVVNNNCIEEELPGGQKTVACIVAGS